MSERFKVLGHRFIFVCYRLFWSVNLPCHRWPCCDAQAYPLLWSVELWYFGIVWKRRALFCMQIDAIVQLAVQRGRGDCFREWGFFPVFFVFWWLDGLFWLVWGFGHNSGPQKPQCVCVRSLGKKRMMSPQREPEKGQSLEWGWGWISVGVCEYKCETLQRIATQLTCTFDMFELFAKAIYLELCKQLGINDVRLHPF